MPWTSHRYFVCHLAALVSYYACLFTLVSPCSMFTTWLKLGGFLWWTGVPQRAALLPCVLCAHGSLAACMVECFIWWRQSAAALSWTELKVWEGYRAEGNMWCVLIMTRCLVRGCISPFLYALCAHRRASIHWAHDIWHCPYNAAEYYTYHSTVPRASPFVVRC